MACDFSFDSLEEFETVAAYLMTGVGHFEQGNPTDNELLNGCCTVITNFGKEWRAGEGWITERNSKRVRYNISWLDEKGWLT